MEARPPEEDMTRPRRLHLALLALAILLAAPALAAKEWDQARIASLSKTLVDQADDLYDAFFKQPKVTATPNAIRDYERLQREIRHIKQVARGLNGDLQRGETKEQTQNAYESLVSSVNWARERARSVFTTKDVNEKANLAQETLAEIGEYYEPAKPAAVQE
jgi:hypothetical protein